MGAVFQWLPTPSVLEEEDWIHFLDRFSPIFLVLLIVTWAVAVLGYRNAASRRRIYAHTDVFAVYSPLKWLWAALAGALVTGIAAGITYVKVTGVYEGMVATSCEFFLLMLLAALLISYLSIALGPLTPRKFKYRPAAFLHRSRT